jgi:hypothetical protein
MSKRSRCSAWGSLMRRGPPQRGQTRTRITNSPTHARARSPWNASNGRRGGSTKVASRSNNSSGSKRSAVGGSATLDPGGRPGSGGCQSKPRLPVVEQVYPAVVGLARIAVRLRTTSASPSTRWWCPRRDSQAFGTCKSVGLCSAGTRLRDDPGMGHLAATQRYGYCQTSRPGVPLRRRLSRRPRLRHSCRAARASR